MVHCALVADFLARQGVLLLAGLLFLLWTALRVRWGYERRDVATFAADCSKQAGQQATGGVLMLLLASGLAEGGLDPLAWYGAQYPFEIVLTTYFTGVFRRRAEAAARRLSEHARHRSWAAPMALVGQYGPAPGDWSWRWYALQLAQAVLLIGLPARLVSLGLIWASLAALPEAASPVGAVARLWYGSGLSCSARSALILYVIPLAGDALQFIVVDRLQKFVGAFRDDDADGPAPRAAGLVHDDGAEGGGRHAGLLAGGSPASSSSTDGGALR